MPGMASLPQPHLEVPITLSDTGGLGMGVGTYFLTSMPSSSSGLTTVDSLNRGYNRSWDSGGNIHLDPHYVQPEAGAPATVEDMVAALSR
jgi:hypothetical protein